MPENTNNVNFVVNKTVFFQNVYIFPFYAGRFQEEEILLFQK